MEIGEALKLLRVHHGMKQVELVKALEISSSHISQLESGHSIAGLATLERYSDYFNIPVSSIIFIAENLESARQGKGSLRHCRAADLILQVEMAKAELKNERKQ